MVERVSYEDELKGILEEVASYNKNADKALIAKAFNFAKSSHDGQKRESGANFFLHPIAVAKIIISLKADSPCIAATFLHDVVEDTPVTLEQVKKEFGDEVADLVEGVTKIDKISFKRRI